MDRAMVRVAAVLALGAMTGCDMPGRPAIADVKSPRATYNVRLSGRVQAPSNPFVYHAVWAEVLKGTGPHVPPQKIHVGDSFDDSFNGEYTGSEWPQESVLRFKSAIAGPKTGTCEINVANRSTLTVEFLRVKAEDLFIFLDVLPGSEVTVQSTCWLRADLTWVEAEGRFSDDGLIPWKGVNFVPSGNRNDGLRYQITLKGGGVNIAEVARNSYIYSER